VALDSAARQYASKVAGLMWRMEEEDGKRKEIPTNSDWLARVVLPLSRTPELSQRVTTRKLTEGLSSFLLSSRSSFITIYSILCALRTRQHLL
jgi:hypothetical protein